MFVLQLNDMRSPKIEMVKSVARAETKEELEAFIEREKGEGYHDENWVKIFCKGGPLEWCNHPGRDSIVDVHNEDHWVARTKQAFVNQIMSIPVIPE